MSKARIIQTSTVYMPRFEWTPPYVLLVALRDDGTLWQLHLREESDGEWEQIDPIDEEAKS